MVFPANFGCPPLWKYFLFTHQNMLIRCTWLRFIPILPLWFMIFKGFAWRKPFTAFPFIHQTFRASFPTKAALTLLVPSEKSLNILSLCHPLMPNSKMIPKTVISHIWLPKNTSTQMASPNVIPNILKMLKTDEMMKKNRACIKEKKKNY